MAYFRHLSRQGNRYGMGTYVAATVEAYPAWATYAPRTIIAIGSAANKPFPN